MLIIHNNDKQNITQFVEAEPENLARDSVDYSFPDFGLPTLTQKPKLTYTIQPIPNLPGGVTMNQIVFQCDFNEPDMHPSVLYDVTFLIGTERVFEVRNLKEGDFPAELKETDFSSFQNTEHQPNLGYGNNVSPNFLSFCCLEVYVRTSIDLVLS